MVHSLKPHLVCCVVSLLVVLTACSQSLEPRLEPNRLTAGQRFIVVLNAVPQPDRPSVGRAVAAEVARAHGLRPSHTYGAAIVGFAAEISEGRLTALQRDPRIAYVEEDRPVEIFADAIAPNGVHRIFADANDGIDIDGSDDQRVDVDVAVIDTGIDLEHPDLNVVGGVDCSGGGPFGRGCKSGGDDDHYHGTHVAGTVAALDQGNGVVGVAPGARLWAVKVLDGNGRGYTSWIVAGIDWVTANGATIEVANMSLGGSGFSQAQYDAIQGAVNEGVAFAVAAGNSEDDANDYSPAAFDNVLTVSALADFDGVAGGTGTPTCRSDQDDTLADFSNWGDAVQIAAPGVCIRSTYPIEEGSYGTISGTSMASPHVAGALALLASGDGRATSAVEVQALYDAITGSGNHDWIDDSDDGVHEPLLDVSDTTLFSPALLATGDGGGDPNRAPTASFTYACSDLACDFDGSGSSDGDGSIAAYAWEFGDGATSTAASPSHAYAAGGTYTVTLTVSDDDGASDTASEQVTVSAATGSDVTLAATGSKVKGVHHVDLSWSGATSTDVDVYRDGSRVATVANDGEHTDVTGNKGGGSYAYRICEADTATCSNEVTVIF